jgi:hypothetical protein
MSIEETMSSKSTSQSHGASDLSVTREQYDSWVDGLLSQGLDQIDAVETLNVGVQQMRGSTLFAAAIA